MSLMAERSENVRNACSACGGNGVVRRDGPDGHAPWCPYVNSKMRSVFVRHTSSLGAALAERADQRAKLQQRREFAADLYEDGYTISQIAEILAVSTWTVRDDLAQKGLR